MPGHADPIEAVVRQTVQLQRLNNAIARDSSGLLKVLFDDIAADIARIDPTGPAAMRYQRARISRLVARVDDMAGDAFGEWNQVVRGDLARLGKAHGAQVGADLVASLGAAASIASMVGPSQNMVKAILDTNPFQGETLRGWAAVQKAATVRSVRQVVQRGMMEERGISWLVRQVRGGGGVRGVWNATRRNAEAIVRTAVTEVASQAQLLTYRQNPNVVAEVEWLSALDSVTCLICQGLDGRIMPAGNPSEIPPAHIRCRCTLIPIVNWRGLGMEPPGPGERFARDQDARMRGESLSKQRTQVSGDTKYESWLRGQKPAVIRDILGPGRAKLFTSRKMPLARMVGTDRRILTLNQLEAKLARTRKPKAAAATRKPKTPKPSPETVNTYRRADGTWTPERQRLHKKIVDAHFANATPVDNPTASILGGGPASGKGTAILGNTKFPKNMVRIDPDEIKKLLPEYDDLIARGVADAGTAVHAESSYLSEIIAKRAASGRYNFVMDGSGDRSYKKLTGRIKGYRAGGARIEAHYVTVDSDVAVSRALARGKETGRFVPEEYNRATHANVSRIVPRVLAEGHFDDFVLWDNNGKAAFKVAVMKNGKLDILDPKAWQRFLDKDLNPRIPLKHSPGTSAAFRANIDGVVEGLPVNVRRALRDGGIEVRASEFVTDAAPHLTGVRPRGWAKGKTWDNADGFYDQGGRRAVVTEKYDLDGSAQTTTPSRQRGVITHELGHGIDGLGEGMHSLPGGSVVEWRSFSRSPAFRNAYLDDIAEYRAKYEPWPGFPARAHADLSYYLQAGHAGPSEAFAEIAAQILVDGPASDGADIRVFFPRVAELVSKMLKGL